MRQLNGNTCDLHCTQILGSSIGTKPLSGVFHALPQSFRASDGKVPKTNQDGFCPHPFGSHQHCPERPVVDKGSVSRIPVSPCQSHSAKAPHTLGNVVEQNTTNNGPEIAQRLGYWLENPEFEARSDELWSSPNTYRLALGPPSLHFNGYRR